MAETTSSLWQWLSYMDKFIWTAWKSLTQSVLDGQVDCNSFQFPNIQGWIWNMLQQKRSFFKFLGLIFSLHGLGLCSHHSWGYKGTFLLPRWRDPLFHLGSLSKVISVHLILWLYMGTACWWQILLSNDDSVRLYFRKRVGFGLKGVSAVLPSNALQMIKQTWKYVWLSEYFGA